MRHPVIFTGISFAFHRPFTSIPDPLAMILLILGAFAAFLIPGLLALVMKEKRAAYILLGLSLLPLIGGVALLVLILNSDM